MIGMSMLPHKRFTLAISDNVFGDALFTHQCVTSASPKPHPGGDVNIGVIEGLL
jgi:hypothetical protein